MLRPATPLSVTLFFAFVLLLISVISTPLVKGIKLASSGGVDFGVFGYCKGDKCSGVTVGYPTNTGNDDGDFSLPPSTRHSLSPLLIVHPIAALFTLVLLVLSLTAHLHSPSHSPRYLLALLILTLPALILSLLAFLVDVLMFLPHLLWPGWTVLAATILLASSGIITCAMRRTLVSRKARKKRIAENAEMNGENFYARQATDPPPLSGAATAPTVDSGPGADKLPDFATFDAAAKSDGPSSNDDRIPLNSRTPSNKSQHEGGMTQGLGVSVTDNRYGGPPPRMGPPGRGRGGFGGARDEYGNPLPPSAAFGPGPGGRRENPQNRGGPGFSGPGRGGYPPGGRGGYGGRGGWSGPDGAGPMMGRGGPRGPPPAYNPGLPGGPAGRGAPYAREQSPYGGPYGRGPSPGPPGAAGFGRGPSPGLPAPVGYGRRPSPGLPPGPGYGRGPSPGPVPEQGYNGYAGREGSPGLAGGRGGMRGLTPPPPLRIAPHDDSVMVGQAVEMDATTGSPSPSRNSPTQGYGQLGESDTRGPGGLRPPRQPSGAMSPTSIYSTADAYVPARAAWGGDGNRMRTPLNTVLEPSGGSDISAVELPTPQGRHGDPTHTRVGSGEMYYEDVDPRFAQTDSHVLSEMPSTVSPSLPPVGHARSGGQHLHPIMTRGSYEDLPDGARSPAASDTSHYTSVSQRGVNPNWPGQAGDISSRRPAPQQQQRDMLFAGNNDFELPGAGRARGGGRGGRMPALMPAPLAAAGGRYPGPNQI